MKVYTKNNMWIFEDGFDTTLIFKFDDIENSPDQFWDILSFGEWGLGGYENSFAGSYLPSMQEVVRRSPQRTEISVMDNNEWDGAYFANGLLEPQNNEHVPSDTCKNKGFLVINPQGQDFVIDVTNFPDNEENRVLIQWILMEDGALLGRGEL